MTKQKRVKKAIEPVEFAAIESKLEAAFRSLPFWSPEPGDPRIRAEWALPDMVRELAMLHNSERKDFPWDVTNRKLEGMKRYAHALLEDPLEIAGLPLQTRLLIASVANLDISKPSSSPDGRPKKNLARRVAEITAERFFQLTQNRPTRRTASERNKDAAPGEAYGPFIDLLNRVYEILGIEASAASQAAGAIRFLNKKYPQEMSDEDENYRAFEKQQARAEKKGIRRRIEDAPPPGMLPDGKLNTVEKDAPAWKPNVVDAEGNEVEIDD